MPDNDYSFVYVLTNPAMPGLVKIGLTSKADVSERMAELYTTGVPFPFELNYACRVVSAKEVEDALHFAFGPQRVNIKREFFKLDPQQVIVILRLLHTEDATAELQTLTTGIDQESIQAANSYKKRRPSLNYHEMGIPNGSKLQLVTPGYNAEVIVIGPKKIQYGNEEMSLTAVTQQIMNLEYSIQPTPHWSFNGKLLSDIYEETYSDSNSE